MNSRPGNKGNYRPGGSSQESGSNAGAAPAAVLGEGFHNPYTFIPFAKKIDRYSATPRTFDELDDEDGRSRKSGVLEITIKTLAPLLTCDATPENGRDAPHKVYRALTIGNDVVVPATGVRGTLRTLMTILSGGTLGYLDEDLWLTQGRDAPLGPRVTMANQPKNVFLAKVITPGSATRPGKIQVGTTKLIEAATLCRSIADLETKRPSSGKAPLIYTDPATKEVWEVKLCGRPVNTNGKKKEGLFKPDGKEINLPESFWRDYQGRNRHGIQKELQKGDLVWIEPTDLECTEINDVSDIESIQWARWGRRGRKLSNRLPSIVLPDSMNDDLLVDMVTDLFGQIHHNDNEAIFAARIRPHNCVFRDAAKRITREVLAPLAAPHPGCIPFYFDNDNLDQISADSPLRGYKVYRNTQERGENAPWKYSAQGVYIDRGELKNPPQQKVNKTADLLDQGCDGLLRIAFRGLDPAELALLLTALSVDWKLGGGKPLGLGHCRAVRVEMIDEDGKRLPLMTQTDEQGNLLVPGEYSQFVKHLAPRINIYRASQVPVPRLRYPRAVGQNSNGSIRAGLIWFGRHASPKKSGKGGLQTLWTAKDLLSKAGKSQIAAQKLPKLDPDNPGADQLYGYDMVELDIDLTDRKQRKVGRMERFDSGRHAGSNKGRGANTSQNRETRAQARDERGSDMNASLTRETAGGFVMEFINKQNPDPAQAEAVLTRLQELGITPESSNKWQEKFARLREIAGK